MHIGIRCLITPIIKATTRAWRAICLLLLVESFAPGFLLPADAQSGRTNEQELAAFLSERAFVAEGRIVDRRLGELGRRHGCGGASAPALQGLWLTVSIDSILVGALPNDTVRVFVLAGSSYLASSGAPGADVLAFGVVTCDDVTSYIGGIIPHRGSRLFPVREDGALEFRADSIGGVPDLQSLGHALSERRGAFAQSAFAQASGGEEVRVSHVEISLGQVELLALTTGNGRLGTAGLAAPGGAVRILLSPKYSPPKVGDTMLVPRRSSDGGVIDLRTICHTNLIVRGELVPALGVPVARVSSILEATNDGLRFKRAMAREK